MPLVLAIDPGSEKCGLALVDGSGAALERKIVHRTGLDEVVRKFLMRNSIASVVLGDGTTSRRIAAELAHGLGEALPPVTLIDERHSTLEARSLYFADHPPRGLWRLVPLSLRVPPESHDDYAALVLARRYLAAKGQTQT